MHRLYIQRATDLAPLSPELGRKAAKCGYCPVSGTPGCCLIMTFEGYLY